MAHLIRKKTPTEGHNYSTEFYEALGALSPELSNYPLKNMEPWRRFDLNRLTGDFLAGVKTPAVNRFKIQNNEAIEIRTLALWKTTDEIFAKKVQNAGAKMPVDVQKDFFESLLYAYVKEDNVQVLRIKAEVNEPVFIEEESSAKGLGFLPLFVYIENGAKADLYISTAAERTNIISIRAYHEANSDVEIHAFFDKGDSSVAYVKSFQEEYSTSGYGVFSLNGKNRKVFVLNKLQKSAYANYYGFHAGAASKNDHDFHILHEGSDSNSNIYFKMALTDNAYSTFWGKTVVVHGTRGCQANQLNKNLLLGENSRVDAIPKLEIDTEDVAASHGSATGEISEEEMFYLMSRGLESAQAKKLLVYGFIEDVFQKAFRNRTAEDENAFVDKIWQKTLDIVNLEFQN